MTHQNLKKSKNKGFCMARWVLFRFHMTNLTNYVWDELFGSSDLPYSWNEKDNDLSLELDIPGFSKDEVEVKSKLGVVSISGNPKTESRRKKFKLSFKMPNTVDGDLAAAELANGVLRVTIPKKEAAIPKEVSIKVS
jgi:HSP20 family molecular chaperone IbpA